MSIAAHRSKLVVLACMLLAGCGGGGGDGGGGAPPATFSVGGTVSGLDSVGLVLQNNAGPDLAIASNGAFTFPAQVATGSGYSVTIKTQPNVGPLQVCTVANGSGTVANAAVTNVAVTCASRVFKFLYTTSTTTNDLRGYSVDATSGALTALSGPPLPTGIGPGAPAPHPTGKFVFLATRGDAFSEPPRLAVYSADAASGALTELPDSPYELGVSSPPLPGAIVVQTPSIHPSGAFGYLPVLYSSFLLYGAAINTTTGSLAEIPGMPIDLGFPVGGMSYDPTGSFLFVPTSPGNGDGEIRSFAINAPSGVLTPIGSFPTGGNTAVGATLTPSGDYLLTTNINSGTLMVFAVNKTAGTLTPVTQPIATGPAGSRPLGIVLNRRNTVFYTTNIPGGPASVAAFRLDAATGGVTPVGTPVASNDAGSAAALHASGRFLYQYNSSLPGIQRFSIDPTTGALTLLPDVTAIPGATQAAMILDVSGRFLFFTNTSAATVSSYAIDAATGALTLVNSVPTSIGTQSMVPFLVQ